MSNICFMLLLGAVYLTSYINTANGIFFFHTSRRSNSEPVSLDQAANDDSNPIIPFPPFLNIIIRRSFNPFRHYFEDGKENVVENSSLAKQNEPRINKTTSEADDFVRIKLITKPTDSTSDEKLTREPVHRIQKKVLLVSEDPPVYEKIYNPLRRLYPFRHFTVRRFDDYGKNKEASIQKLEHNTTQEAAASMIYTTVNQTDPTTKDSLQIALDERMNCSRTRYILRRFLVWRVNWASLAMHLGVLLLISALVTLAVFLCKPYYTAEQYQEPLKFKTMHV